VELPQAARISPRLAKATRERSIVVPLPTVGSGLDNARCHPMFQKTACGLPGAVDRLPGRAPDSSYS
jgi:hypothetical protein